MDTFKAIMVREIDDRIEYQLENTTLDDLSEGEVLIKVAYSSINYKDMLAVQKNGGVIRSYPMIPGIDLSGTVVESDDERFKIGQKVIAMSEEIGVTQTGGYAEYARVKGDAIIPLPESLSLRDAEIFGIAGFTAATSIDRLESAGMRPNTNSNILVTGATGGVGSLAILMLLKAGYDHITALVRKDYQVEVAHQLGAHEVILTDEFYANTKPLNSRKFHYVIDTVGGKVSSQAMTYIHNNGSMTMCGNAGGNKFDASVLPLILRGIHLYGISVSTMTLEERMYIWGKIASHWNVSSIARHQEISFIDLHHTINDIKDGNHLGRTIININK